MWNGCDSIGTIFMVKNEGRRILVFRHETAPKGGLMTLLVRRYYIIPTMVYAPMPA